MPITATGLAALAGTATRTALAACPSIQALFGVDGAPDPVAAAEALLFVVDADAALAEPYGLITVQPQGSTRIADGLRQHRYRVTVELWLPQSDDADDGEQDFINSANLADTVDELWDLHDAGSLDFELIDAATDQPIRDDDTGAGRGSVGNVLTLDYEAYDG